MRRLSVLLITLFISAQARAEIPSAYFRSDNRIVIDHHAYSPSFFTGRYDLDDKLASNPEAQAEYLQHRKMGLWSGVFIWGSLVSLTGYTFIALNNNSYSPDVAIWLCFIPEFLAGVLMQASSRYHLLRAINLYNGVPDDQALKDATGEKIAQQGPAYVPSLGLKWTF